MDDCKHNWVFQEKSKTYRISGYEHYTAHFKRVDRYYCSNCCAIKEMEKQESIDLPFGGIRKVLKFAPVWY